jgi:hypothetical protein
MRRLMACSVFLLVLVMSWMTHAHAGNIEVKSDSRIEVVYIHAADCPYCRNWQLHTQKRFSKHQKQSTLASLRSIRDVSAML